MTTNSKIEKIYTKFKTRIKLFKHIIMIFMGINLDYESCVNS